MKNKQEGAPTTSEEVDETTGEVVEYYEQRDPKTGEVINRVPIQKIPEDFGVTPQSKKMDKEREDEEKVNVRQMSSKWSTDGRVKRGKGLDYDPTGQRN